MPVAIHEKYCVGIVFLGKLMQERGSWIGASPFDDRAIKN